MDKLLTIAEASEVLAICPKHFRRLFVNTGEIAVISLGKGTKGDRINPSDVKELIGRKRRCYSNEGESGTSSSKRVVALFKDPLGQPAKEKQKNSSAI